MHMGLREANQRFCKAVKLVKAGEEVILTERGKPIAVLKPLAKLRKSDAVIRQLEAAGLLRTAVKHTSLPGWTPRRIKGAPLSQTIRGERDAS
jgi:prevent-host-death family protein